MHSFGKSFKVPKDTISRLVGKGGVRIQQLRAGLDLRIDLSDNPEDADTVDVVIEGIKKDVLSVEKKILELVDDLVCLFCPLNARLIQ